MISRIGIPSKIAYLAGLLFLGSLSGSGEGMAVRAAGPRVIVLGFDGADPSLVQRYLDAGKLPHLARLRDQGSFRPLATTRPAESPVSWSAFATGMNPGKTRIFDFISRVPGTYLPDIALTREGTEPFLPETSLRVALALAVGVVGWMLGLLLLRWVLRLRPLVAWGVAIGLGVTLGGGSLYVILSYVPRAFPKPLSARAGVSFWKYTTAQGVKTVVLQAPVTYPAEDLPGGELLTGLGTPDLLKTFGTWFLFTSDLFEEEASEMGGYLVPLDFEKGVARASLRGPRNFTVAGKEQPEVRLPVSFSLNQESRTVVIEIQGKSIRLQPGAWSDWVEADFSLNPLITLHGMTRFHLLSIEPNVQVYAEPLNWDPRELPGHVPISYPRGFAKELAGAVGLYETVGWMTATNPLKDEAIGYDAFLEDVDFAVANGRKLLFHQIAEDDWQCFVSVFLFTDRVQHMLYRFLDPEHPLYDAALAEKYAPAVEKAYREMDAIVGEVMEKYLGPDTTLLVVSDHGFHSFRKGVSLNSFLVQKGHMSVSGAGTPEEAQRLLDPSSRFFARVDWSRTRAYALGLSGIYINVAGREPQGIVAPGAEYEEVKRQIIADLMGLEDPVTGERVVRSVYRREDIFSGPYTEEAHDLEVGFAPGYRVSWQTAMGGIPPQVIEPNPNNWSGDHVSMDPEVTPGIFFSSQPIAKPAPHIMDIAPTVLHLFGIGVPPEMDGEPLIVGESLASAAKLR